MAQTDVNAPAPATPLLRKFHGCTIIQSYEVEGKLGEGTFGEVYKARSKRNGACVALKKILMHNEKDGFPITALREIKLLKLLCHVNVLKLEEMAVERNKGEGRKKAILYMVTPYMDHDLSGLLDNPDVDFTEPQIKCYMLQLLEGLRYLHDNHILHRDMKAANLLVNNKGILQIADFGLARHYDEPAPKAGEGNGEARRDYTTLVVTRWYRPPELLLQLRRYTPAIDMWGVGCVFGEMFKRKPILSGNSDLNQIQIIFDLVGSPTEDNMPGWSELPGCEGVRSFAPRPGKLAQAFREQGSSAISLLAELLKLDWRKRINAIDALNHPYFKNEPLPARPEDIPRFEDSHELDRRNSRGQKQALPPAPAGGTVGMGPNGEWTGSGGPNGGPWINGDHRPPRGNGWPPDRGAPGNRPPGPQRGNDSRIPYAAQQHNKTQRGPPPPPRDDQSRPVNGRRHHNPPNRGREGPPENQRHPLPPYPPPPEGRHPLPHPPPISPPAANRPGGNQRVDTYIPQYSNTGLPPRVRDERPPRDDRHGRDGRPGPPDSRPFPGDDRMRRANQAYWDRDRYGASENRDFAARDHRRSRSRSPIARDRMRERERDPYRR